jgi:uncharacterized protein YcbK (DUF882 family)
MANIYKISRRSFLFLGIFPSVLQASPLVDFERGLGLFSDPGQSQNRKNSNHLNLFNDPEPELDTFARLGSNQSETIVINNSFQLKLINANTKQKMSFQFPTNYKLSSRQVSGLNNFLKDWRTDEIKNIDTAVLEDFLKICSLCAIENKVLNVNIHSGFRSKKTNEYLRRSSYKVAKNSMHILGKAIDFSIPGMDSRSLAKVVRANTRGGVGSYQNFVHLDSGPKRSWS